MAKQKEQRQPMPPLSAWFPAVALGWLIPGGGHFLLKRRGRGALLLVSITAMFLLGLMMRGALFEPQTGDLLTTLINVGGFLGDFCAGVLYLLARMFGYYQADIPGPDFLIHTPPVHDYGTKFLVTAGLLNILAMVDAFEIAAGRKD
jgi:TM2 domain-containing membrane protein YozV